MKVKNVPKRQVYVSPEWYKSAAEGQQPGYEHVFLAEVAYGKTEMTKLITKHIFRERFISIPMQ